MIFGYFIFEMKVIGLSDLHGYWTEYGDLKVPGPELLIISGDLCMHDDVPSQIEEIPNLIKHMWEMFPDLLEIIIVPGNHDYALERVRRDSIELYRLLGHDVHLLVDEGYEYISYNTGEILKLWGAPRCNLSMAFPRYYNNDIKLIPSGLDILITHEAPRNYELKCILDSRGDYGFEEPGNKELMDRVLKIKPRYHFFGHIHQNDEGTKDGIRFYNNAQVWKGSNFKPVIKVLEISEP